jgi:hypothetical protein
MALHIARLGDGEDKVLAHINSDEAAELAAKYGGSVNDETGLPQFGQDKMKSNYLKSFLASFPTWNGIKALVHNPHKSIASHLTGKFQKQIGPYALATIPYVGPYLTAAAKAAYKGHDDRHKPGKQFQQAALNGVEGYFGGSSISSSLYGAGGGSAGYAKYLKYAPALGKLISASNSAQSGGSSGMSAGQVKAAAAQVHQGILDDYKQHQDEDRMQSEIDYLSRLVASITGGGGGGQQAPTASQIQQTEVQS